MVASRPSAPCKLLFLGENLHRKGGEVALRVARALNEAGLATELIVVGSHPPLREPLPAFIRPVGYISKRTREGLTQFKKLLAESHFMILPTRADCSPHAINEANAFGVPYLTTSVGGIPTMIRDDLNGKTFSIDANIDEYCSYITDLFSDYDQYVELAHSSFNEYQSRLNWTSAAKKVKELMTELM